MSQPDHEPCGCQWGCADQPFIDRVDFEPDVRLAKFTECIECGAVWSTADDNEYVTQNGDS